MTPLLGRASTAWTCPHHTFARRIVHRLARRAHVALAAALAVAAVHGGGAAAQAPTPTALAPAPGTTALTYRLSGDWFEVPYSGTRAVVRRPADLSSAPDGTLFVLDQSVAFPIAGGAGTLQRNGVQVVQPDGTLQRILETKDWLTTAFRLDADWSGGAAILGWRSDALGTSYRVIHLAADGRLLGSFDPTQVGASDLAVLPDGRIAVAERGVVSVTDVASGRMQRIVLDMLGLDGGGPTHTYSPYRVDASADGRLTVLAQGTRPCPGPSPTDGPSPTPHPTATPRPSLGGVGEGSASRANDAEAPQQGESTCGTSIAFTLDPSLGLEAKWTLGSTVDDLAVRDGAVYISHHRWIRDPLFIRPLDGLGPSMRFVTADILPGGKPREFRVSNGIALDVAPDGAVWAVWQVTDPFTAGPVRIGIPGQPSQLAKAVTYHVGPEIEGPVRPQAIAAGADGLFVLDGATMMAEGDRNQPVRVVDEGRWENAVQTWTFDGRLVGQWVHDANPTWVLPQLSPYGAPEDVAAVGDRLYTATPGGVWLRTGPGEPVWFAGAPGVRIAAVDADEAAVAALDIASAGVRVWSPDGQARAAWPIAADGRAVAASDVAVAGGRVFVADTGGNRVLVRTLDGDDLGAWQTHDGPLRLDATPDGDLVVLGYGGWGLRYTDDGALRAAWRLPGAHGAKRTTGTDIAAGPDGRIYVTHSRVAVGAAIDRSRDVVEAAGIWAFDLAESPADARPVPPDVDACPVDIDKTASPASVALGDAVAVTLTVHGACPRQPLPQQIMLVVDTSWSMNDGFERASQPPGALERARQIVLPLLAALDPAVVDVGLVTFANGAALQTLLADDLADVRGRIIRAQADGDTMMGAGVALAHGELNGPRRDPNARRTILIVSDGVFKDDPTPAVAAARADGIAVHGLVVTTPEFKPAVRRALVDLLGADFLHLDPAPERAKAIIDAVGAWRDETVLFEGLVVRDVVPANMRYVEGTAVPPAAWDPAARTLTWTLGPQPPGRPVTLRYAVVPLEVGVWPTNVEADVTWTDARGVRGARRFPVPIVTVEDRRPHRVYLPFASRGTCTAWRRPIDLVLVHDISSSMAAPAADGVRTKLEVAAAAALVFVERLDPSRDRLAVVTFDAEARVAAPLSHDRGPAVAALAAMTPGRGTRIDRGLRAAIDVATAGMRGLALPVVVVLSDGLQNGARDPVDALLPELHGLGARIVVVGYGAGADDALLRAIAGADGDYRFAPAVEDLRAVYEAVGRTLICP